MERYERMRIARDVMSLWSDLTRATSKEPSAVMFLNVIEFVVASFASQERMPDLAQDIVAELSRRSMTDDSATGKIRRESVERILTTMKEVVDWRKAMKRRDVERN